MMHNRYLKRRSHGRDGRDMHSEIRGERFPRYKEYVSRSIGAREEPERYRNMPVDPAFHERESRRMQGMTDSRDYRDYGDYRDYRDYRDYGDYGDYGDYRRGRRRDYADGREYVDPQYYDMGYDRNVPSYNTSGDMNSGEEKKYHEDLERWIEKLKRKDRFNQKMEDVIGQAKQMGVKFDQFTEEEFYATYLMLVSDFKTLSNEPRMYMSMAKEWLMDDDIETSPSEKLCIYFYEIVKGEGLK